MIQKRFVKGLTEKRENWKNSAGSFRVYSFNYLHFPLAVLGFRFLSWEYSDRNFRSFWHYKLSHFRATPLTNPYKCSTVILNYSFVVIKVELVHNTASDSEKGWVGRLSFKNCFSNRWGWGTNEVQKQESCEIRELSFEWSSNLEARQIPCCWRSDLYQRKVECYAVTKYILLMCL